MRLKRNILLFLFALGLVCISIFTFRKNEVKNESNFTPEKQQLIISPAITPVASPSASPTPKPMNFSEMNQLYGPCVSLPVLMFHHVEDLTAAKTEGHLSLTVGIEYFKKDLDYLATKGYNTISPEQLVNFFDNGGSLPTKPVLLTFDDGYADNGTDMYQAILAAKVKGVIFTPTGLLNNPGYLDWEKIREMAGSGLISFGNHTWSHKNVGGSAATTLYEITTADTQLSEQGLNNPKIFAYPYGLVSTQAVKDLTNLGYKLAFTEVNGKILCEKKKFELPRIRVGNAPLSSYGL